MPLDSCLILTKKFIQNHCRAGIDGDGVTIVKLATKNSCCNIETPVVGVVFSYGPVADRYRFDFLSILKVAVKSGSTVLYMAGEDNSKISGNLVGENLME